MLYNSLRQNSLLVRSQLFCYYLLALSHRNFLRELNKTNGLEENMMLLQRELDGRFTLGFASFDIIASPLRPDCVALF